MHVHSCSGPAYLTHVRDEVTKAWQCSAAALQLGNLVWQGACMLGAQNRTQLLDDVQQGIPANIGNVLG